ncbi:MAG: hypothetical protein KKA51_07790 [Nanoarchaeota archaeon]|nr:hypothetical protein [Nanoarchaeota archaeon]
MAKNEQEIGVITHYFSHISVGVVEIKKSVLKVGDKIHVLGATTDFTQKVESMQIDHKLVKEAKPGDDIGLKVKDHVREHDKVFKIIESKPAVTKSKPKASKLKSKVHKTKSKASKTKPKVPRPKSKARKTKPKVPRPKSKARKT